MDERDERDERRSYYFCEGLFFVVFVDSSDQLVMDQSVSKQSFSRIKKSDGFMASAVPGCSF